MKHSVSIRVTPGELAALNALKEQEGGTITELIRSGLVFRLNLAEHRKVIHKIVQEELKAAIDAQRAEWDSVRGQMVETNLATLDSVTQLLASFMEKLTEGAPPTSAYPEPVAPPPATTGGGVFIPARSSR